MNWLAVVGQQIATNDRFECSVKETSLRMAISQRQPPVVLVVHADRGSQYASDAHHAFLARHHLQAGTSRKANCWERQRCLGALLPESQDGARLAENPTMPRPLVM